MNCHRCGESMKAFGARFRCTARGCETWLDPKRSSVFDGVAMKKTVEAAKDDALGAARIACERGSYREGNEFSSMVGLILDAEDLVQLGAIRCAIRDGGFPPEPEEPAK